MALFQKPAVERIKPSDIFSRKADVIITKPSYTLKTKLLLRVDKIMDGNFAGLYQLVSIDKDGNERVVTDANTKKLVIMMAGKLMVGMD